jgi:hypothetical protein
VHEVSRAECGQCAGRESSNNSMECAISEESGDPGGVERVARHHGEVGRG